MHGEIKSSVYDLFTWDKIPTRLDFERGFQFFKVSMMWKVIESGIIPSIVLNFHLKLACGYLFTRGRRCVTIDRLNYSHFILTLNKILKQFLVDCIAREMIVI